MNATWVPSPNYTRGRAGFRPEAIVVHIMQGTLGDTDSWFTTTKSEVSAHFGVAKSGEIHQYVAEGDSAWHAGRVNNPSWSLLRSGINPNLYTIGIEHEGESGATWPDLQRAASAALIAELANRWNIPLDREHIVGHFQIYSKKPFCPGTGADFDALISAARDHVSTTENYQVVTAASTVTTRMAVNIRRRAPTTHAGIVRVVPEGSEIAATGWTSHGEAVHGNAHWYRDADGNFFWAGATDKPLPI